MTKILTFLIGGTWVFLQVIRERSIQLWKWVKWRVKG